MKNLFSFLQHERPQTIALVLSYAEPDQAATVISELPKEKQIKVVESVARMESAFPQDRPCILHPSVSYDLLSQASLIELIQHLFCLFRRDVPQLRYFYEVWSLSGISENLQSRMQKYLPSS
mgnify:CR=1 FL=1